MSDKGTPNSNEASNAHDQAVEQAVDGAVRLFRWGFKTWIKFAIIILILNLVFGGLATEYVIEFWGARIKGQPVDVPFLPCALGGLFIGPVTIPATVFTWLLSFVL